MKQAKHIKEMSTVTIQHEVKDIEILMRLIDVIITGDMGQVSTQEVDALERLHHKFKTARPDMIF